MRCSTLILTTNHYIMNSFKELINEAVKDAIKTIVVNCPDIAENT